MQPIPSTGEQALADGLAGLADGRRGASALGVHTATRGSVSS